MTEGGYVCSGFKKQCALKTVDLQLSKALFSLDPDNLQLVPALFFLGLGALFCCSFFCSLDQPCKTLQTVQVAPLKLTPAVLPSAVNAVPFCFKAGHTVSLHDLIQSCIRFNHRMRVPVEPYFCLKQSISKRFYRNFRC